MKINTEHRTNRGQLIFKKSFIKTFINNTTH